MSNKLSKLVFENDDGGKLTLEGIAYDNDKIDIIVKAFNSLGNQQVTVDDIIMPKTYKSVNLLNGATLNNFLEKYISRHKDTSDIMIDENNRGYILAQTYVDCPSCGMSEQQSVRSYNSFTKCTSCNTKLFMRYANADASKNDSGDYFVADTLYIEKGK